MAGIAFKEKLDGWPAGSFTGTFRGFVPSFASASRALEILLYTPLLQEVQSVSLSVTSFFKDALNDCPNCGEVRAAGFMFGIEIVEDIGSRTPSAQLAQDVATMLFSEGIIVELGGAEENVIRLLPPLNIDTDVLFYGVERIAAAIWSCSRVFSSQRVLSSN